MFDFLYVNNDNFEEMLSYYSFVAMGRLFKKCWFRLYPKIASAEFP